MKYNIGKADYVVRITLGITIVAGGLYLNSWWGLIAIAPLATVFTGVCPLYSFFGINTRRSKK